jgi:hypothetical protein
MKKLKKKKDRKKRIEKIVYWKKRKEKVGGEGK